MNILVSACLVGIECRYSASGTISNKLLELASDYNLIPVCPEQLGGLPTPRNPAEICGKSVIDRDGKDVTDNFSKGARETLKIAQLCKCSYAILKERSPSCGSRTIYDGNFSGQLKEGMGLTVAALVNAGITVYSEESILELIDILNNQR